MRKNILAPSILAADFGNLERDITTAARAGAEYLHLDVMDGLFVPNISFGIPIIEAIREKTDSKFDVHLMIEQPERYIETFAQAGADSITVHAEATKHLHRAVSLIKECGCKAAVALNPATGLGALDYVLDDLDMVLLMTVNPGFGGQKMIPQVIDKIHELRELSLEVGMDLDIEVDGGVDRKTIDLVLEAGANVIVSGSAVFKKDIAGNVQELLEIMNRYREW